MTEHFQLDVDPEQLRAAARQLSRIAGHLDESGRAARNTPGEIGDQWTGDAAVSIKAEMTALGRTMVGFRGDFEDSAEALRSLARDYDDALKQVTDLNRKWDDAEEAYQTAVTRADSSYEDSIRGGGPDGKPWNRAIQEEFRSTRQYAYDQAADTRRTEQHNLSYSYGMMCQWLAQRTREAGTKIVDAAPFEVTAEQVDGWSSRGTYPVEFDRSSMWNTLKLAGEVEELGLVEAGEEAASEDVARLDELLEQRPLEDPDALRELLLEIGEDADDPYYAEALTRELGPDGLNEVYDSIDGLLTLDMGSGDHRPEDFWPALQVLNNVIAHGLSRYNNIDLAEYVGAYAGPPGGPPRLALLLGSDYADGRLHGLGLAFVTRMTESKYPAGSLHADVARDLQHLAFPDGFDEMVKHVADSADADALAQLMEDVEETTAAWIAEGLLDTGERSADGILFHEVWAAKERVLLQVLEESLDEDFPQAVEALFEGINNHSSYYTDQLLEKVADTLDDPDRMMMLAANARIMDAEVVARLANRIMDDIDVEDLLTQVTVEAVRDGDGAKKIAEDLGFLLSLSDAAGISVDYSGVVESVAGTLAGLGRAAPVAGPALDIFLALVEASEEANQKFEDYGENWSREQQHQMLAWVLYLEEHGPPPGYDEWLEDNEDRLPSDAPDRAVEEYLKDLRDAQRDTPQYDAWSEIEELMEQIGETRRIGGGG